MTLQRIHHGDLEVAIWGSLHPRGLRHHARAQVLEVGTQLARPPWHALTIDDVLWPHGGEHSQGLSGAGKEHVESSPAVMSGNRTEPLIHCARARRWAKGSRYEDHIAFVALHVF